MEFQNVKVGKGNKIDSPILTPPWSIDRLWVGRIRKNATRSCEKNGPNDGDDDELDKRKRDCWRSQFARRVCTWEKWQSKGEASISAQTHLSSCLDKALYEVAS